jgi:hypothetical protein
LSVLKPYLRVFRGVSKGTLPDYVELWQCLHHFRQYTAFASRAKKGELVTGFDHFDLRQTAIN